jgi:hypothetical protein
MSLLMRKRTVLVKEESTYGVDPTPTGAANAILLKNLNVSPLNAELAQRDLIRPYLGNSDTLVASKSVSLDFEVEMQGSGTAGTAPAYASLLKACAMSETVNAGVSVVYAPVSSSFTSVTIYFFMDGILHKVLGAMGSVEFSINTKQIPVMKFSMQGLYVAPTDTANPTAVYTGFLQPQVANTANTSAYTLLGYSGCLQSLNFNVNNQVTYRTLIGCEEILLVDRKPAGTAVIEAPTIAAKDYFTAAVNGTTGTLSILHGTTAGHKVQLDLTSVTIQGPSYTDDNGTTMLTIPFVASPVSGNDEFSITVK